jgi:Pyruvate/2-oxoacid:ferredoxin oxidoreductase delta subunit
MKIHAMYFSPGGTTKTTVLNIAKSLSTKISDGAITEHNMLKKENRSKKYNFSKDDILVLGLMTLVKPFGPVNEIFKCIQGNQSKVINIAMFGNGMYGNSLKVMKNETQKRGFINIASAAFIGAMSYNRVVGANRPDEKDIKLQQRFAQMVGLKISSKDNSEVKGLTTDYPWNSNFHYTKTLLMQYLPLGKIRVAKPFNTLKFTDKCIVCGKCEYNCPVGAIDLKNRISNSKICIGCLCCVNNCDNQGIIYTNKLMKKAAKDCEKTFAVRREPEFFL